MRTRVIALLIFLCPVAHAITPWDAASIGQAVAEGTWERSETLYRELLEDPNTASQQMLVKYNLGLSLFNQQKYEDALPFFEEVSADKVDLELAARAMYNKGNTLHALEKVEEAKEAFKQALLMNPDDDDARYNLEVLQEEEDKQNQQNPNQDQDQNKDQNQDQKDQNKDQNDQNQDQKDQKKDGDKQKQDGDKDQKDDAQDQKGKGEQPKDGKPDKGDSQDQDKPGQQQPQMSEAERKAMEEAQERARLLEFFKQQERDGRPAVRVAPQRPPVEGKTW